MTIRPPDVAASWSTDTLGLAVALGCGLLIGVERERRKGQGPTREAAGLRSFAVVACMGGMAQWLGMPSLVVVGAVLVAGLAAIAYWRSREAEPNTEPDPGLTTELALFATYLIGVLAVRSPAVGAACGAGLALLLAARSRLHHFATRWLTEPELHDGLLLAALALIALPLTPANVPTHWPWVGGMALQPLAWLVVLILVLQGAAHGLLRVVGPRAGLPLVGLVSGFVSSTATVATMGRQARAQPVHSTTYAAGAGVSGAATWLLALMIVATLDPAAAPALAPMILVGAVVPALWALRWLRSSAAAPDVSPPSSKGPLRLREAALLAFGLVGISSLMVAATRAIGPTALHPSAALAALADAHAAVAALASMHAAGTLSANDLALGLVVAVGSNTAMRVSVAAVAGGAVYGRRVGLALGSSWGAAVVVWWWLG